MQKMKLFWLTGLVSAMGAFALQGCGDDSEDNGTGGAAGSGGSTAKGGSGGSGGSSGGSTSKGGSGGSSGGSTSKGGSNGGGGDPTGGGGDPTGGGGDPTGGGGDGNEPSADCAEFCTGPESIENVCGDEEFFPADWEGAGCLLECLDFEAAALTCWNNHRGFAAGTDDAAEVTLHCGHATGQPDNTQCPEL